MPDTQDEAVGKRVCADRVKKLAEAEQTKRKHPRRQSMGTADQPNNTLRRISASSSSTG